VLFFVATALTGAAPSEAVAGQAESGYGWARSAAGMLENTLGMDSGAIAAMAGGLFVPAIFIVIVFSRMLSRVGRGRVRVWAPLVAVAIPLCLFLVPTLLNLLTDNLADVLAAAASTGLAIFFAVIARRRTPYYDDILNRILGFREFIRVAEKDRMERLFAQDPQYYYNTLPYAWVFGLSDVWAKKFEGMVTEPPEWYSGSYGGDMFTTWLMIDSMNRLHHASLASFRPEAVPAGGSDSGGGWGGGDFSGGGGFSGGGFGGGGGGSW
jgi:uncharacterized membrane protein YgcG